MVPEHVVIVKPKQKLLHCIVEEMVCIFFTTQMPRLFGSKEAADMLTDNSTVFSFFFIIKKCELHWTLIILTVVVVC